MKFYSPWAAVGLVTDFLDVVLKKEWSRILIPAPPFVTTYNHSTKNMHIEEFQAKKCQG